MDSISLGELTLSMVDSVVSLLSHKYYSIIETIISSPAIGIDYSIFERYFSPKDSK
jgi:hypothetical protein